MDVHFKAPPLVLTTLSSVTSALFAWSLIMVLTGALTKTNIAMATTRELAVEPRRARTKVAAAVAARSSGANKDGGNSDQILLVAMLLSRCR